MKHLLLILALFASFLQPASVTSQTLLAPIYYGGGFSNWEGVKAHDQDYAVLNTGNGRFLTHVTWSLPHAPADTDSVGFVVIVPEGMEVWFTSSEFGGNFWLMGKLVGPYDGEFKVKYVKAPSAGSGYVQMQIPRFTTQGPPNGSDNVLIDCAYLHGTKANVESIDHPEAHEVVDWYDYTGRHVFHGSRKQLEESGLTGAFISREGKIFVR